MLKYIILGLVLIGNCFASAPRHNALLVAEYVINNRGVGDYSHLVRYNFIDGNLTSKYTILEYKKYTENAK